MTLFPRQSSNENNRKHINCMKRKLLTLGLILTLGGLLEAADTKLDLTGTWKQTQPASQTGETIFTFKLEGETLTGTILKRNGPNAITNGVVRGDQVSFQTRHEASSPKGTIVTTTFSGRFSGDTITGTLAIETKDTDFGSRPW